ncbi:hypothetical protein TEA_017810 [Camellia sinensis var. sinensis]|uniref:Uncharacterized protein n=1 Tax=Camellia sinensis var. sinensis TaxID=542762 RepID=A0A4S4D8F4_CAMSN|nr:hypothetical protein TEA_017810 [Camellia sinensis var. sinensis]
MASHLNILPQPLALAIREFGGGNGGGDGFWKAFGWGGFDGWRRKRQKKLGLFGFVIACGLSVNGWRRGVKDWILGFCFCAVLVGFGLRREILQRWAKGLRAMETRNAIKLLLTRPFYWKGCALDSSGFEQNYGNCCNFWMVYEHAFLCIYGNSHCKTASLVIGIQVFWVLIVIVAYTHPGVPALVQALHGHVKIGETEISRL